MNAVGGSSHRAGTVLLLFSLAWSAPASSASFEDAARIFGDVIQKQLQSPPAPPAPAPGTPPPAARTTSPAPTTAPPTATDSGRFSDAEKAYVPAQATTRVADAPRRAKVAPVYGSKFSTPGDQVTITNPYLDLKQVFFARLTELHYAADGSLIVGGRVGLDKNMQALGTGYWKIAADGAITPLFTRSTNTYGKTPGTKCDAPYARTHLEADNFAPSADGSVVKSIDYAVVRIEPDGYVRRLAGAPYACEEHGNASRVKGFVDGPADTARFDKATRVVSDPHGNVWVVDQNGCALRRIASDGQVTTVISPEQACGKSIAPENRVGLHEIAWDPANNELVSSASITVAQPVHNLYNTVWRIRPTGEFRRVLYSHKVGRSSPSKHYLDGIWSLAVSPQGRIHIGSKIVARSSASVLAVLRIDEAGATVVPVTGTGYAGAPLGVGDEPQDGPAARVRFRWVKSLAFAPDGTLYVRDEHLVRKLDPGGQVSTWAF
jgi:hypothetical protein